MANTLTGLMPDLYEALDVVSRELVGFIPAVTLDAQAERAALNQTITVPITPAAAAEDTTPGSIPPDTGDQTIGNTSLSITKSRTVPFRWTGEEQKGVNTGPGYQNIRVQQIAQALRTLTNEAEADLAALHIKASRAYGTAGTTPFGSDLSATAQVQKIMKDNGCPMGDCSLVMDTTAGAKLLSLATVNKVNEMGSDAFLRQGQLLNVHGLALRESAQVVTNTAGTGTGYLINKGGGYAKGATVLAVDTGSGTIVAGDIITIGTDTNKYVVAKALASGELTIAAPGLLAAAADNAAITVVGAATRNLAFARSAIILATRAPALPEEGDSATDRMVVTDPRSGLSFEVAMYPQYRRVRYEVSLAWGGACIKPEHCGILLG